MSALKTIALIPARSGSKGLPGKNTKRLGPYPLIAHTVLAAKESGVFDHIIVSTDCQTIADIALEYGAQLPPSGLRSADLAEDTSSVLDVIKLICAEMKAHLGVDDFELVLLQPTSPLRTAKQIKEAMALKNTLASNASVIGVSNTKPLSWQGSVSLNGELALHQGQALENTNRQQLQQNVVINGTLYIANASRLQQFGFSEAPVFAYVMPEETAVDIDTALDFDLAAVLYQKTHEK